MKAIKSILSLFVSAALLYFTAAEAVAKKVRSPTPFKTEPHHALVLLAGEEKGFWKQNGLEVQWIPFTSGTTMLQAIAAASVGMGGGKTTGIFGGGSRGGGLSVLPARGGGN